MSEEKPHVMLSVNMPGNNICVDVFKRDDGSFGFEEFRRDHEDGRGWFLIGYYSHQVFDSFEAAKQAAEQTVGWLSDVLSKQVCADEKPVIRNRGEK